MPDAEMVKSWKIAETRLERARHALPASREQEHAPLLVRYREFMEHNELELALDVLDELGHLTCARGGFWRDWCEPPKIWAWQTGCQLFEKRSLRRQNPGSSAISLQPHLIGDRNVRLWAVHERPPANCDIR